MSVELQQFPTAVQEALKTAYHRIGGRGGARLLWERGGLSNEERKRLGGGYLAAYEKHGSAIRMWQHLRGGTQLRAIIDVALAVNFLSHSQSQWLLQQIGEADPAFASTVHLQWNKEHGELRLNGEVIRKVRVVMATNVVGILDSFQECGWPTHMDNPLPSSADENRLRETLKTLNKGLKRIHFYADGTGEGIRWEAIQISPAPTAYRP